jgi:hypothetical protein
VKEESEEPKSEEVRVQEEEVQPESPSELVTLLNLFDDEG